MAKVKTSNQEIPIPDAWVVLSDDSQEAKNARDGRIRRGLANFVPSINNAQLTYAQEGEETVVRVTTQLGTKAVDVFEEAEGTLLLDEEQATPLPQFFTVSSIQCDLSEIHQTLRDAPPYVPPVLKLAWELKWLQITGRLTFKRLMEYQPKIQEALTSREPYSLVEHIHQRLKELPPAPSPVAPLGF
ncbi:MAG: hypothetical protein H0U76_22495 [Ktedonobacteraceae bacterium]|nr:hypothetical protein [Ktedonobacteraceae bacterium]